MHRAPPPNPPAVTLSSVLPHAPVTLTSHNHIKSQRYRGPCLPTTADGNVTIGVARCGTLGHAPSTSNCIFLVTSEPHKLCHWTLCGCIPKNNMLAYSFATVYCMKFIIFLRVTLKLFSPSFVPLLAPNPGDATDCD